MITAPAIPDSDAKLARRASRQLSLFVPDLLKAALGRAFVMLRPDFLWKNPVMFVVEVGTAPTVLYTAYKIVDPTSSMASLGYLITLDVWLFLTVLFANFAEALAEARGKAQADSLRKTRQDSVARRLKLVDTTNLPPGTLAVWLREPRSFIENVASSKLKTGDLIVVEAGQVIPADREIVEGIASVDESAITGLVRKMSFTPLGGLVGEPRVNVLELILAMDREFPMRIAR